MTSGARHKLLALSQPALHQAEKSLMQSDGTKLVSVRILPDLSILKVRFEPGPERKSCHWVKLENGSNGMERLS
jgi:hypothetical protein